MIPSLKKSVETVNSTRQDSITTSGPFAALHAKSKKKAAARSFRGRQDRLPARRQPAVNLLRSQTVDRSGRSGGSQVERGLATAYERFL